MAADINFTNDPFAHWQYPECYHAHGIYTLDSGVLIFFIDVCHREKFDFKGMS